MATPFVKWMGGKRELSARIIRKMPTYIERYYELFVGGGAVFYRMKELNEGMLPLYAGIKEYILADSNKELITTYKEVRDNTEALIYKLKEYEATHCKKQFYEVRTRHSLEDPLEIATRFIYLNRTCFNGQYRVNSQGFFNSPCGFIEKIKICQEKVLRGCARALQGVQIIHSDFKDMEVKRGSVVYCDPPYWDTFSSYTSGRFEKSHHIALRNKSLEWAEKNCYVIISNSNSNFIRDIYPSSQFHTEEIIAKRFFHPHYDIGDKMELLIMPIDR